MLQRVPPHQMMVMYLMKSSIPVHLHRTPVVDVHLLASMEVTGCASVCKRLSDMSFCVMHIKLSISNDDHFGLGS